VCYLGVFKNYEWLDLALHALINSLDISNIGMRFFQDVLVKNDRKTIPYELKKRVWHKYNNNDMSGKCYVCDKKLDIKDMECGHIIAHALGGEMTLNNLQPTCKTCNRDMGVMNLNEYKQLFK
jgi:5-methylcytosine-specific restriction endonuclease McrA